MSHANKFLILSLILSLFFISPAFASTGTIQLQEGWNLFSLPVNVTVSGADLLKNCAVSSLIYHYNALATGGYESVSTIQPGLGYWVMLSSPCTITINGNVITNLPALKAGQNQIGSFSTSAKFSDIIGNCNVLSGPTMYDPTTRSYVNVSTIQPGLGYFINVVSDCKLGSVSNTCSDGTPYGFCSVTTPLYCSSGTLINNCAVCGCPSGQTCQADGSCSVTQSNIIAYWKFDEGSGTTAYDSSPNKNDATLYNSPLWVTGKSGKALQFSGSNYVEAPNCPCFNLSSQVTITAWINPSSIGAYNRIVAKSYTSNANPWTDYGLLFDNANHIRLEIATGGTQYGLNGLTTIPLNQWTFVAGTYDGATMKVYVNGVLDNSVSHTGAIDMDSMPLSIGRSGFGSDYFTGSIDEVKVWSRALTADEIKKEYGNVTLNACSDGTAYGSCNTTNKPKYCDNGNLVNKCGQCGCPSNYTCNTTTNACYLPIQNTCDSTCKAQNYTTGTCEAGTSASYIKGVGIGIDHLWPGSQAYTTKQYPDQVWQELKNAGVNVLQVGGGNNGAVLWIDLNENDYYGTYNPNWATNLEAFLEKADSYGMKVFWQVLGDPWGVDFGIDPPQTTSWTDLDPHYTPIPDALRLVDKLGGNNSLHHNFLNDSRILWWEPINEADLNNPTTVAWTKAVLQEIKKYGGKTEVSMMNMSNIQDGYAFSASFPDIIKTFGDYPNSLVDYLDSHPYDWYFVAQTLQNNGGTNADMYTPMYNRWSQEFQLMINSRGHFPLDHIIITEFGIPNGYSCGTMGNSNCYTLSQHQQAQYIQAMFDVANKYGITNVFYWSPVIWNINPRYDFGFIEYNGTIDTEPYNTFKAATLSTTPSGTCQSGETSVGQDGCSANNLCCCLGAVQQCSSLNYPSDRWQRVWYVHSTGACLGNGPDETSQTFDTDWGTGTVAYNQADDIEFHSSRTINLQTAGIYTFTLGSDDGARLWIDGVLQLDKWADRAYTTDNINVNLATGNHKFRIDYYENGWNAEVSFSYTAPIINTCTPATDIIKQVGYPSGSCQASSSFGWSHSICGNASVCNQGSCKLVSSSMNSYTLPSGKYARGNTITIPYTISNVGSTPWCFLTQTAITKSDASNTYPTKFNSVAVGSSASDSLSYAVSCSDPLGTWSSNLYSTTDYYANGGWDVWRGNTNSFSVVQCLSDSDCTNCLGSGYSCDLSTNTCKAAQNLIFNPSVETGTNGVPDYWTPDNDPNLQVDHDWCTVAHTGSRAICTGIYRNNSAPQWEASEWAQRWDLDNSSSPFKRGNTYEYRTWYQTSGGKAEIFVMMWDSNWNYMSDQFKEILVQSPTPSTWAQSAWLNFTIPSNAAHIKVGIAVRLSNMDSNASSIMGRGDDFEAYAISAPVSNACSDGTAYGQCSSNKPLYCSSGTLINSCSQCGCPTGYSCNTTTNACYSPVTSTCDSTCKSQNFNSGTCRSGSATNSKNLVHQPFSPNDFGESNGGWVSSFLTDDRNPITQGFVYLDSSNVHYLTPSARISATVSPGGQGSGDMGTMYIQNKPCNSTQHVLYRMWVKIQSVGQSVGANIRAGCDFTYKNGASFVEGTIPFTGNWKLWAGPNSENWAFLSLTYPDLYTYPHSIGTEVTSVNLWIQNAPASDAGNTAYAWVDDVEFYVLNAGEPDPPAIGPPSGTCQSNESSIGQDGCSSNNLCCCSGTVQKCSDGTAYSSCSSNKPLYCSSGTLINSCSQCGCSSGYCNSTSQSCQSYPNSCTAIRNSDNTIGWTCTDGTKGNFPDGATPSNPVQQSYDKTTGILNVKVIGMPDNNGNQNYWTDTVNVVTGKATGWVNVGPIVNTCSDGTAYSSCSSNKPLYCSSGTLINKCSPCGCPSGLLCNTTTSNCYITSSCNDQCNLQNYSTGTCRASSTCSGNIILTYSSNPVAPNSAVTPIAYGLSNCNGKTVYFKSGSCSGTQVSSCTVSGNGCSGSFTSPSSTGTSTYYACIDENNDNSFGTGESSSNALNVAFKAPDFTLNDDTGKSFSFSGYKGNVVLLEFFSLECSYCMNEMPQLKAAKSYFSGKPFSIISLTTNPSQDTDSALSSFSSSNGYNWVFARDTQGLQSNYGYLTGTSGTIPTLYFIDQTGFIRYIIQASADASTIESNVNQLLNSPAYSGNTAPSGTSSTAGSCQSSETSVGQDGCPSNNLCCCSGSVQKCSDNTLYGFCSSTQPKYCSSGTLINSCSPCGCPSGQTCNTTTNSCYTPVSKTCSDGTAYSSCSSNKPLYCSSGTLINSCSQCGCASGYTCNTTTNACYITPSGCSALTYPTDRWQRVWYTHSTGACLGNGPDESSTTFDTDWSTGIVAYNQADDIQFSSSRTINFATAGTYTFTLGSDDGARLWIDNVLEIDQWVDRAYTTNSVSVPLAAGNHQFRIDYYENTGNAEVSFSYTAPIQQCTPATDIIKQVGYPSGSCLSSTSYAWSHSTCGNTSVCNQGSCKLVSSSMNSYTLPSGKYARGNTITIPYTISNVGSTPWCFLTQTAITKSDASNTYPTKFNSVAVGSSASDSLSYQLSCSDPLGAWSGSLYSTTDYYANGGWDVWRSSNYNFNVVECLNNQDCTNCLGSGYTCNTTANACYIPVTSTCDSTCKSQNFASGNCEQSSNQYSPILRYSVFFGTDVPTNAAGYSDVCQADTQNTAVNVAAVHAANPNYKALVYFDATVTAGMLYSPTAFMLNLFMTNGWLIKDAAGNYVKTSNGDYYFDIGNPDFQTWVANWILTQCQNYGYDGVMLDDGMPLTVATWTWPGVTSTPVNPRNNNQPWTDAQVAAADTAFEAKIKSVIGSRILWSNGGGSGDGFYGGQNPYSNPPILAAILNIKMDIVSFEGGFGHWQSSTFVANFQRLVAAMDLLQRNNVGVALGAWGGTDYYGGDVFGMATLKLIQRGPTVVLYGPDWTQSGSQNTLKTYNALGAPLADYTVSNGIYSRQFQYGTVYVNPSNQTAWIVNAQNAAATTSGTCQSGESSIGQDGCSSNNLCCCKSDLVGYWKFDEGSGTTAKDSSPFKNDGTLYNNPTWTTGKSGSALSFNGVNQYVTANNVPVNISSGSYNTVSFWMNWKGTDAQMPIMFPQNFYDIAFYNGCFGFNTGNGDIIGIPSSGLANKWTHVAAVFYNGLATSTSVSLYINGVKQSIYQCSSTTIWSKSVNSTVEIGGGWGSNYYFGGTIDEVKIWNRALSATEIMKEYNGTAPVQQCSADGTAYGQCSANKPQYCSSGTLINACGSPYNCGCPSGYSCNTTINACYITLTNNNSKGSMVGFSGIPWSQSDITNFVSLLESQHASVCRLVFDQSEETGMPSSWTTGYITYLLNNWSGIIVVDVNHPWSSPWITDADFPNPVEQNLLTVLAAFPNNPRVWVELFNEPNMSPADQATWANAVISAIRKAGYNNTLVWDFYQWSGPYVKSVDPLNNTYQGEHWYVSWVGLNGAVGNTASTEESHVEAMMSVGITKILTTEIGADSYDDPSTVPFTTAEIAQLSSFLNWSKANKVSNCVWLSNDFEDWASPGGYESLGFNLPPVTNTCSDGTSYGQCSSNKPLYCSSGALINNCGQCGCASGYTCNTTTNACYITPSCNNMGLGTPSVNPTPTPNQQFQVLCPVTQTGDCVYAYANGSSNQCQWINWSGNNGVFNCTGLSSGTYTARCVSGTGTTSNCCADTKTSSYTIAAAVTCGSCGTWTNGACGAGGCTNQRQQTRTCTPSGCTPTDGLGTSQCVADSTCGTTSWSYPSNNVLVNGQFTNGFNGWDDENGWNGANGWASLDYTNYHLGAPSLRLTPDPHGIYSGNPTGDESSAWASSVSISQNQKITYGCWMRTDSGTGYDNLVGSKGGVLGVDFKDSHGTELYSTEVFVSHSGDSWFYGDSSYLVWGTPTWTHLEVTAYNTAPSVATATVWIMMYPPYVTGATWGLNVDDVYLIKG